MNTTRIRFNMPFQHAWKTTGDALKCLELRIANKTFLEIKLAMNRAHKTYIPCSAFSTGLIASLDSKSMMQTNTRKSK
jgi:hypothetical protein